MGRPTWKRVSEEKMMASSKLRLVSEYTTNAKVAPRTGIVQAVAILRQ